MKTLIFLFFSLIAMSSHPQIYRCTDHTGKLNFTDQPCSEGKVEEIQIETDKNTLTTAEEVDPPPGKVVYKGSRVGSRSRFIRVSIFEETDEYIIFEVIGYNGEQDGGKLEFRVNPNIPWRSFGFSTHERGLVKGFTRVSLNDNGVDGQKSDVITLQLWYYTPDNKSKYFHSTTVPYKKEWSKKEEK